MKRKNPLDSISSETKKYFDFINMYDVDNKLTSCQLCNDSIEATGDDATIDMIINLSPTMYKVTKIFKTYKDHKLEIDQTFFNKADIVEQTGVSIRSVNKWLAKGWLREYKLSKRKKKLNKSEKLKFIKIESNKKYISRNKNENNKYKTSWSNISCSATCTNINYYPN